MPSRAKLGEDTLGIQNPTVFMDHIALLPVIPLLYIPEESTVIRPCTFEISLSFRKE